jgi:hypothetical protein
MVITCSAAIPEKKLNWSRYLGFTIKAFKYASEKFTIKPSGFASNSQP